MPNNPANFKPMHGQADNIVPAGSLYGEPLAQAQTQAGVGETSARVSTDSFFRRYEPPKRRAKDNPDKELCGHDGCRAFPSKKHYPWCAGHARSKGLIK